MRRITGIIAEGAPDTSDVLCIDHDLRNRRRMVYTTAQGHSILLEMPRAVRLRDGDGLVLDDGSIVRVEAAMEALIEIHAPDLPALVRIAWHLGNRHLPTQLMGHHLRIRHDHVIAEMVAGLGGHCQKLMAPFDPEGGAYAGSNAPASAHSHHHHDEGHDHGHGHRHG